MKKIFALLLVAIAVFALIPNVCFAEKAEPTPHDFLAEFVTACIDRKSGTTGEANAADFLLQKFSEIGYTAELQEFNYTFDNVMKSSQNVVATKKSANSVGKIIIGAHYDNVGVSEGANDNASGVAVMLSVANRVFDLNLAYDVVFVAFGAEEEGFFGSTHYVSYMEQTDKNDTLLMINIDSVAMGDTLYFFGEDVETTLNNSLVEYANSLGYAQKAAAKPLTKDVNILYSANSVIPYYHSGYASDNLPFRVAGIPCETIISGNFEKYFYYTQSADVRNNTMHTAYDTLAKQDELFGEKSKENMQIAADTVVNALTNSKFQDIIITARGEMANTIFWESWPAYVIYGVLLAAFIVFGILMYRKLLKQDIMTDKTSNSKKVFDAPDAEDIYTFLK